MTRIPSRPRKRVSSLFWTPFAASGISEALRDFYHKVTINYYPPKGDDKEAGTASTSSDGWDTHADQSQFLCKDSILAAPLVLDLVLFMDLAQRAEMAASRNGFLSTSRALSALQTFIPSMTFSSSP